MRQVERSYCGNMTSERFWEKWGFRIGLRWLWIEKRGRELNKAHQSDTTQFNEGHSTLLHVSVPKKSSLENSLKKYWNHFSSWCPRNSKNWRGLNILFGLIDHDFFGIETCSSVECRSLNWVVSDWCVLLKFSEDYNGTGWLRKSMMGKKCSANQNSFVVPREEKYLVVY